ncbi:hypothetical protein ACHAXT_010332 [Thalassiosira profunda]
MDGDGAHQHLKWRIWGVIDELEANGLSSASDADACKGHDDMIKRVIPILRQWGKAWAGQPGFLSLLNKRSLLHEVEESIVALHFLAEWLESRTSGTPVTLVDVCCGKGILSMLASYLFAGETSDVSGIIMLDKQNDINWNHIQSANLRAAEEGRPAITTWGSCNLHEIDELVEKLEERQARFDANHKRDAAKKRFYVEVPCYLCSEMHQVHTCNLLPPDESERIDVFKKAAALQPCWKCGEVGHQRKDCPSTQQASKPRLVLPPTVELDVGLVMQTSEGPFESYCHLLGTAVERDNVEVRDVGLFNSAARHDNAANRDNWNRDRKSIFIVASA